MATWRATFDKKCMIGRGKHARAVYRVYWRIVDHRSGHLRLTPRLVALLAGLLGYLMCCHDLELYHWHWGRHGLTVLFGVRELGVKTTVLNTLGAGSARRVNRAHGWTGKLLQRNTSAQAVDADAAEAAMTALIAESVRDQLLDPDAVAFSGTALLVGGTEAGVHVNRTRMHQVRKTDEAEFSTRYSLELAQLPHLKHETPEAYAARWKTVADAQAALAQEELAQEELNSPPTEGPEDVSCAAPFFGDPDLVNVAFARYQIRAERLSEASQAWRDFNQGRRPAPLRYPEGTHCPGALCRALPVTGVPPPPEV